jgi:hypothetical protein
MYGVSRNHACTGTSTMHTRMVHVARLGRLMAACTVSAYYPTHISPCTYNYPLHMLPPEPVPHLAVHVTFSLLAIQSFQLTLSHGSPLIYSTTSPPAPSSKNNSSQSHTLS